MRWRIDWKRRRGFSEHETRWTASTTAGTASNEPSPANWKMASKNSKKTHKEETTAVKDRNNKNCWVLLAISSCVLKWELTSWHFASDSVANTKFGILCATSRTFNMYGGIDGKKGNVIFFLPSVVKSELRTAMWSGAVEWRLVSIHFVILSFCTKREKNKTTERKLYFGFLGRLPSRNVTWRHAAKNLKLSIICCCFSLLCDKTAWQLFPLRHADITLCLTCFGVNDHRQVHKRPLVGILPCVEMTPRAKVWRTVAMTRCSSLVPERCSWNFRTWSVCRMMRFLAARFGGGAASGVPPVTWSPHANSRWLPFRCDMANSQFLGRFGSHCMLQPGQSTTPLHDLQWGLCRFIHRRGNGSVCLNMYGVNKFRN